MLIYDVRVNHLDDPIGYRMEDVRFSWKIREARGQYQTAARVVVAEDVAMDRPILDTGWDTLADSLGYPVALTLAPRKRYYYRIHVRTDAGEEGCSDVHFFETGKMDEPWQARWISCDCDQPRHPIFEKDITPAGEVASARLYICGLGLYEASFDGVPIGNEYMAPYCTDYNRWVQYQSYDVTGLMGRSGKLRVLLGNGWYLGRFGFDPNKECSFYGDEWKLLAELHLTYRDGSTQVIGTDESWIVSRSNLTFSNIYDGEHRDDTLPALPLEAARFCAPPTGAVTERMSTPVTVHEKLKPAALIHTPKDEQVLDLGQEITGSFRLKLHVPRGREVRIQTGEILQEDCFYNANLRSAKSEYRYISSGEPVVLEPHFTFYGYRYVKIEGVDDLRPDDFTALVLHSQIPQTGHMHTGHDLVNRLLSNIRWGMKGNFLDVPTDCPQRDERMGWTGDTQVFSPTAMFLHECYSFYAKFLHDLYQEQQENDGLVPNVVPSFSVVGCACAWGDAACIVPWNVYRYYGDKAILRDQLPSMRAWVDYLERLNGDDHAWRRQFHFGDWLALDNMNGNAEEVMGATDVGFIANVFYADSARLVAKAAAVLGEDEIARHYNALADREFQAVKDEYFSSTGRPCITTQTGLLLALNYNLSENRPHIIDLLKKNFEKTGGKLQTGFVGTPILCNVLSDNGMEELAWQLLLNEEYPGWLREVKLGATTVWERWNSVLDDGTISGIGMNSLNHYAYGSIGQWMFRRIAGLDLSDAQPGCRRMEMKPLLHWALRSQETVFDSPSGEYRSAWLLTDPTHVRLQVTVPFGCSASLTLPNAKEPAVHELAPGSYTFVYETDRDMRPGIITMNSTIHQLRENKAFWEQATAIAPIDSIPIEHRGLPLWKLLEMFKDHVDPDQIARLQALLESAAQG